MTYIVIKTIKGNRYKYLVRSEREGDRVRQVFVRYLGRADKVDRESLEREYETEEREALVATPKPEPTKTLDTDVSTWYRGLLPEREASETGAYYSSSKEVAEEYAAPAKIGGKEGKLLSIETPELTGKFYETTNKNQIAEDLGIDVDPFAEGAKFDKMVIDNLSKQGYSGVHYTTGTFEEEELHVFPKPAPEAVAPPVEPKEETTEQPVELEVEKQPQEMTTYQGDKVNIGELVNFGAFGDRGILVGGTESDALIAPIQTKDGKLIGFKEPVNVKNSFRKIHETDWQPDESELEVLRNKQTEVLEVKPEKQGELWEIKYYDELPISDKEKLAQRADRETSNYIKTLPEYQEAISKYETWKKANPYIFGTGGMMEDATRIYQANYPKFLKQEVLKDYPDLVPKEIEPQEQEKPTEQPPLTEKRARYLKFRENVLPLLDEYGSTSTSGANKKFMEEYMEPLRDEKGVIGRSKWAEASKKFYDERMIPINLANYLTFDSNKSPVSPYPDYRFRATSYEEWQNILKGDRSGAFWSGEPKNYASAIGDYPNNVVLVTKSLDTDNQKYVAGREDNGSVALDDIIAVYRGNPEKHMAERIYEKPDADLLELEGIRPIKPETEETRPYPMSPSERRRAILESRIKRGEPVPEKLLVEFPDLKTKTTKPEIKTTVETGIAGMRDSFRITSPSGGKVIGNIKNVDFGDKPTSEKRGEIFFTEVPEILRNQGIATQLNIAALKLMVDNGVETVKLFGTSEGGKRSIEKLIREGYVSEPIATNPSGSTEHRILIGKPEVKPISPPLLPEIESEAPTPSEGIILKAETQQRKRREVTMRNEIPNGMTESIIESGKPPVKQEVDKAISDSVDRAIAKSKGKVGMLISGGVDSSVLLDFVARKEKPVVFTIVTNTEHPDLEKAKEIAKKYGLEHHIIIPTKHDIERAREAIGSRGKLFEGDVAVYLALEEAKIKGVDTILATDGIDEQTGGYWWHAHDSAKFATKQDAFNYYWEKLNPEHIEPMLDSANRIGIRVEYPFLDKEVVDTLNDIPLDERVKNETPKSWWKDYARNYVSEDIVSRPKIGFVAALDEELIMKRDV